MNVCLRSSRKKPNVGRSHTDHLLTPDVKSHVPYHAPTMLCHGLEKSLSVQYGQSKAGAQHGHVMAGVNQTQLHYVNQMGKTQSKPLVTWHGHSMVCVN
jgi:hypothetical protein